MAKTPDLLHADVERRFPDNSEGLITPLAARNMLHDLVDADQRGPNFRPSGPLSVIYLTQAEAERTGRPYATLEGLDPTWFYNGMECRVDLHPEGFGVIMQLVYDGRANPAEGLLAFLDGTLQLYPQAVLNGKNPVKWVRKDSPEARTANVALYDEEYNATGSPGNPAGYKQNDLVRWGFFNAQGRYYVTFRANANGRLPEPSSPTGDEFWSVFNPPPTAYQAWQTVTPEELRQLQATGKFSIGRTYIVTPRLIFGDPEDRSYPDLFIKAMLEAELEPTGYLLVSSTDKPLVTYDLATDTTTPVSAGASIFEQIGGDPMGNAALAAAFAALRLSSIPLTYPQAVTAAAFGQLVPGNPYRVDYRHTQRIAGTSEQYTGPLEPLYLIASSRFGFSAIGYSELYPQDIIYYSLSNTGYMPGCQYGYIFRRIDNDYGNDCEIDFRNVRFRRWYETFPKPDFEGRPGGYTSLVDNGNASVLLGMFENYFKCRNNFIGGFEKTRLGSNDNVSVFDNLNFTSDAESRVVNCRFTNSKAFGVVQGGTWFRELTLTRSALLTIKAPHYQNVNFFSGTLIDSTISGKVVDGNEIAFTVIHSTLGNEVLAGKTFIDGAEYKPGGGDATGAWPTPGLGVVDDAANTFTVPIPLGGGFQNRELAYHLSLDTSPNTDPIPLATAATANSTDLAFRQGDNVVIRTGNSAKAIGAVGVCVLRGAGRLQSAYSTNRTAFTATVATSLLQPVSGNGWYLHRQQAGAATLTVESDDTVRLVVTGGTSIEQVQFKSLEAKKMTNGKPYKLSMWARADANTTLTCSSQSEVDYAGLGLNEYFNLTDTYQKFEVTFTARHLDGTANDALPNFLLGDQAGRTIWLSSLVLLEVV